MVQLVYFICIVLSTISATIYLIYNYKRVNFSFAIIELLFVLSNMGYFALSISTEVNEALLANKITYIGACILPIVLFLTISHICNVRINPIPGAILCVYSVFVLIMSFTTGYTDWYYKKVELGKYYGATILIKEYGWSHSLFTVLLYGCLLLSVGLLIFILALKKNVSIKNVIILLSMESLSIFLYIISGIFADEFEVTAIIYVIDSIGMLLVSIRSASYNIEDSIINALMEKKDYGYVIIDCKGVFLGCNQTSKDFISCINELRIDKPIPATFAFQDTFTEWINAFEQKQDLASIYVEDRFLKCNIRYLYANGKVSGYLLELVDDTKQQEYIRLLDQVAKNKSNFLSNMSHEIRTPINTVLGMNEMILRESENKSITEYATSIQGAGNTLLALINSILDFSKIEEGKMEIIPVNYDTASMINELVNAISERASKKGLKFEVEIDEKLPVSLYGDDVRIKQIITNLLTNAVKYTEVGSIKLGIKILSWDNDDIAIHIEVQDTGIGIRDEDREKLFELFQRVEEKRNRNIEGTGLGIPIVTKLLEMMSSSLEVESVYGKGSTFGFSIMQKVVDATSIGKYKGRLEHRKQSELSETFLYVPDAKILVVDDNEMNLKVVSGLMKRNGFIPDLAHSGFEAIECVKNKTYDIVFLDHMMPQLDGIETLERMRIENIAPEETVIIVLTANAIAGAKDEYLKSGFDDYLSKPIDALEMEKLIAKYLPESKVSYITKTIDDCAQSNEESLDEWATICSDIDVKAGLKYCMNDKDFYLSMIREYVIDNKVELLNKYFTDENYKEYRVSIHAVKSTSSTIGLLELSERAKLLEIAAKDGDCDYIECSHEDFIKDYMHILEELKSWLSL